MGNIRVRLRGGPKDGTEINVAADASGLPIPRITLPARPRNAAAIPPLLIYERADVDSGGRWEFDYVGAEAQE